MPEPRVALVTGGNRGIGLEICRGLVHAGLTVLLGARDERLGAEAAAQIGAVPIVLDVDDGESATAAVRRALREHGRAAAEGFRSAVEHTEVCSTLSSSGIKFGEGARQVAQEISSSPFRAGRSPRPCP